jgi:hypothetical protein
MDIKERVDEFEERIPSVVADSEMQARSDILIDIAELREHVLYKLSIIGVAVDLKIELGIGEGCFIRVWCGLGSHYGAEI